MRRPQTLLCGSAVSAPGASFGYTLIAGHLRMTVSEGVFHIKGLRSWHGQAPRLANKITCSERTNVRRELECLLPGVNDIKLVQIERFQG